MIEEVLGASGGEGAPLWIDVCDPTDEELARVEALYGIPRITLQESIAPLHLPKHERLGETTFVMARVYDDESRADADSFRELTRKLALFLGDRFLVTIHSRRLRFLDEIKLRVGRTSEPVYLQVLTLEILLAGTETFHAPLERAELRIHELESSLLDQPPPDAAAWRNVLRTKVRVQTITRLLWHTQNAITKFVPRSAVNQPLADDLKDRITSLSFLAESLDNDLDNLLGVQLALTANRTNDVMRILALFSAVFLPITFIVGVYGMNFRDIPELHARHGYAAVWVLIAATVVGVIAWFRQRGWTRG